MKLFGDYADYYDLFYEDKDYRSEAAYVDRVIRRLNPEARKLLELGCGTGKYCRAFSEMGYVVAGLDQSSRMVRRAEKRLNGSAGSTAGVRLAVGDMRSYREDGRYDAVVALFHVMSYLRTQDDLIAAFTTARSHLKPGGLFLFDCWHGHGVLNDPPKNPVKIVENDRVRALRRTTAVMQPSENAVHVRFDIELLDKETLAKTTLAENHWMRYLFAPEIENIGAKTGLKLQADYRWLSEEPLDDKAWYAFFVMIGQ